jgi:hypothetical protein
MATKGDLGYVCNAHHHARRLIGSLVSRGMYNCVIFVIIQRRSKDEMKVARQFACA